MATHIGICALFADRSARKQGVSVGIACHGRGHGRHRVSIRRGCLRRGRLDEVHQWSGHRQCCRGPQSWSGQPVRSRLRAAVTLTIEGTSETHPVPPTPLPNRESCSPAFPRILQHNHGGGGPLRGCELPKVVGRGLTQALFRERFGYRYSMAPGGLCQYLPGFCHLAAAPVGSAVRAGLCQY